MMIEDDRLRPANSDQFGFSGEVVKVEGQIKLPVLVGEPHCQAFAMVNFLVVRVGSAYNAILGRPGQNLVRAVASAYHQKMKFITSNGVGEVRGDQPQSRECYAMALKGKNASETLPIELLDLRDEAQIVVNEPAEDLLSIPLYQDDSGKAVQIGSSLGEDAHQELIQFLRDNADVFAWVPADMPGVNSEACAKDSYPLPKIDQLIDVTAGHELLSFMDAFSGYNQVRMYESDIPKPSFITDQGTYCYQVMPFGLKNAGATHLRLVNKLFRNQIGRNMEVYVDDMLVKSKKVSDHISDLKETFQVLREHNMKLNPAKSTFRVAAGKFLGFMLGSGAGLILTGPENFVVDYAVRFGFRASNNEAGYEALIAGMNLAVQTHAQRLKAYFDSQLIVNQVQGTYKARDERMIKYLAKVCQLVDKFNSFEVVRIPRTENTKADVLSKLAASGYTALGNICMEFLKKSSIECEVEVIQVNIEPCWMDEIIDYLREGKLPGDKKKARKVVQKAVRFSHDGENLYKRSYTLPYLKCLRPGDASYSLRETHEGIYGEHLRGKALAIKVLLRGLYWPTLRQDALDLVKKCERCQKFSPTIN
ncbi:uncharacterized protein LOC143861525 [Tasmannia lanceolata]|uniref:uncharacterized protein LOC143861525 n=1 Tax=Tasmannia lanceolata TaxID=3420 RepID=UPI004062E81F